MINLKIKFTKEIQNEIESAKERIKYWNKQIKTDLPLAIKREIQNIENLEGLLEDMDKSSHFTDPVFSYEEDDL